MNSYAALLVPNEANDAPQGASPERNVVAMPATWQPCRYGVSRRPNVVALAASALLVGGLLSSFVALGVFPVSKIVRHAPIVVELLPEPDIPPPPVAEPVKAAQPPSPIVAPKPLVMTPSPPLQITTSPTPPPPQVSVPGPPSPAPPTTPPAVESVGDLSSKMIEANPPRYPQQSRRQREEGTVVLMVTLAVDGSVADISVSQSSGFERLDRAALMAVRRWRWSPTRRGGAAVMVRGLVEIPFILRHR